jgi:uncharacterized protein (DUF1800 family)
MATNPAQVQERVAWLLQGLLVAGWGDLIDTPVMQGHIDNLRGWQSRSYRDLLETVVRSDAMQHYLTNVWSQPPHPNENLARELMELFALGVTNPRTGAANYTQTDVTEIARALTGHNYDWTNRKVVFDPALFDGGTKTFLGAARGAAGVTEVIDAVAAHASFRYFVPRRLYRELVGTEPTTAVLDALAGVWGATGNVSDVVAAIARRPEFVADTAIRTRVKSPLEMAVAAMRILGLAESSSFNPSFTLFALQQHPLFPPNVSGWPSGKSWLHAGTVTTWVWPVTWMLSADDGSDAVPSHLRVPTVRRLVSDATNLTGGDLALQLAGLYDASPQTQQAVKDYAAGGTWNYARAATTLAMALQSPEFYVN